MRTNLPFIADRMRLNLAESGTGVLIQCKEWPADSAVDPVTESRSGVPFTRQIQTKGFLHFPMITANSQVRQFNEIELGDCILDLDPSVEIDNRQDLTFLFLNPDGTPLDGVVWAAKPVSERLARTWGAVMQGKRFLRPVLLRKATGAAIVFAPTGQVRPWDPIEPPLPRDIDGGGSGPEGHLEISGGQP